MSDDAYNFERLLLRRGPGIVADGLELDDLCPGINIVYGANASGKTTLSRAFYTALWPDAPALADAELEARLHHAEDRWLLRFERGRTRFLQNGSKADDGPRVPPAHARDRYYLSLHDLLAADGDAFARRIARESAGGYDIDTAGDELDYSVGSLRRVRATRQVTEARTRWRDARRDQRDIHDDSRQVDALRQQLNEARQAESRLEAIELALEVRQTIDTRDRLRNELDNFADAVAEINGNELEVLDGLQRRRQEAKRERDDAQSTVDECRDRLDDNPLPDGGIDAGLLTTAADYTEQLRELRRRQSEIKRDLREATRRRDNTSRRLSGSIDPDDPPKVDGGDIEQWTELAGELSDIDARLEAFDTLESLLSTDADGDDADDLKSAIELLRRWLTTTGDHRDTDGDAHSSGLHQAIALASAIVVSATSASLAMTIHLLWLLLLIIAVGLGWLWWSLRGDSRRQPRRSSPRSVYRRDFAELGIDEPPEWSEVGVQEHLDKLLDRWADAVIARNKERRWASRKPEQMELLDRQQQLQRRRQTMSAGLDLDLRELPARTAWFVAEIARWQQASDACQGLAEQLETLQQQRRDILQRFNALIDGAGLEPTADTAGAAGRLDTLQRAHDEYKQQRQKLQSAEKTQDSATRRLQEVDGEIDALFDRLHIEDRNRHRLHRLCEQKPEFDDIHAEFVAARRRAEEQRATLQRHSDDAKHLLGRDTNSLHDEMQQLSERARRRGDVLEELKSLEARIDAAKESSDVESRWGTYETARRQLSRRRRRDYRQAIGEVLVDTLGEQTRDSSRPDVFHRARALLGEITCGQYRLEFKKTDSGPAFQAFDTTRQRLFSLDKLSSGTRVQLLIAVRVAFVEYREEGPKIPLIFDEVLANSDDNRARAIIDAVKEIAAGGRQVFYFTAQRDEVRKWKRFVDDRRLPCRLIDLDGDHTAAPDGPGLDADIVPVDADSLVEPDDASHADYGRALNVASGVSPTTPIGAVHLWVLIEDLDALHRMLELGISTWGQLRHLAEANGLEALGLSNNQFRRIRARADAVDTVLQGRRVGRGRPVDRRALVDSGAVSDTFIERVADVCDDVGGDAQQLIAALDDGRVKRFRSEKTRALENYLLAEGFLDDEAPLDSESIWTQVIASSGDALRDGLIDRKQLRSLMERIGAG